MRANIRFVALSETGRPSVFRPLPGLHREHDAAHGTHAEMLGESLHKVLDLSRNCPGGHADSKHLGVGKFRARAQPHGALHSNYLGWKLPNTASKVLLNTFQCLTT